MSTTLSRFVGASVLAGALVMGAIAAPASAAIPDAGPIVTVSGHVTDPSGEPISGIKVQSDCGCDFESPQDVPTHYFGRDTTSKTGFYSYTVRKGIALNIGFNDPDGAYLAVGRDAGSTTRTAAGYTIDVTMSKASELAGTVVDNNGKPVAGAEVRVYDAKTGKSADVYGSSTDKAGHFHAKVVKGTYKIKFRAPGYYYTSVWYGGAALKADAAAVTVGYGKKLAGLNATVQVKPSINGKVTLDGKALIAGTADRAVVELINSAGAVVDSRTTNSNFSFVDQAHGSNPVGLPANTYTLRVTPRSKGSDFFAPVNQTVALAAASDIRGLVVNLTSTPLSTTDKRSSRILLRVPTKSEPKIGEAYRTTITVESYGSVKGGTVTVYVGGKKVAKRAVPASGKVKWATRFTGFGKGGHSVWIAYSGTSTTTVRKSFLTQVFL